MASTTRWIAQSHYKGGQVDEPVWDWLDTSKKWDNYHKAMQEFGDYVDQQTPSRFVNGYRLIERVTTVEESVLVTNMQEKVQ